MSKFIVLGLPRSRTFWTSKWLSYPGKLVGHDLSVACKSVDEFINSYKFGMDGSVETGAMIGWRLLKHEIPELKTLVIFRPPEEVLTSLGKFGLQGDWLREEIYSRHFMLEAISSCKDVKWINWEDLSDTQMAEKSWEFLLDIPFDYDWFRQMRDVKCEINFKARLEVLSKNAKVIAEMKRDLLSRQMKIGLEGCPIFN